MLRIDLYSSDSIPIVCMYPDVAFRAFLKIHWSDSSDFTSFPEPSNFFVFIELFRYTSQ